MIPNNFLKHFIYRTVFFENRPRTWKKDEEVNRGSVVELNVVNDTAELIQSFDSSLTENVNRKRYK